MEQEEPPEVVVRRASVPHVGGRSAVEFTTARVTGEVIDTPEPDAAEAPSPTPAVRAGDP